MIVHKTKTAMQDRTNPLETASYIFPISNRKNKTTSTQTHHCMVFLENTKKGYLSTNVVGVVAPIIAPRKGYGDFVHHTNPLKEGVLLTLSIDNSLFGLISVRESELVNPLIQLNSVDSTESANSLIPLNYREARESTNSLIIAKTCIAGTSPNVLMKFDSDNFPSRDDTQKAQKEKGSTANAAFLHNVDGDQSLSCLVFLRWRRLISPLAAVTKKPAVLSPSSLSDSIFSITSCGIRTVVICDFAFFAPVTITDTPWDWCMSVYAKKITKKGLWCISLEYSLCCEGEIHLINCEARKCANTNRASIHNVTGANTMAFTHSTQTRPKFTYLFLGTPSDLPTCTPTVLRAEADTEAEARSKFIDWDLTFAAQIRTAAPSRLQLFSTDDGFMWIYEQRQEASHA